MKNKIKSFTALHLQSESKPHWFFYDFMFGACLWDHCKFQLPCIFFSVENYYVYHLFDRVIDREPLQNGAAAPGSKSRIPPLGTLGFGQKHDATADIPLDTMSVMKLLLLCYFCSVL